MKNDRQKKAVKPLARCTLAAWAQMAYRLSQRRAARLLPVHNGTLRYQATRDIPLPAATRPNEGWSMDFVSARLADGRWVRTLRVLDLYTRESLALVADRSLTGVKVATALSQVLQQRAAPQAITVDNGTESVSRAMECVHSRPPPQQPAGSHAGGDGRTVGRLT